MNHPEKPILEITNLIKHYPHSKNIFGKIIKKVHALNGVNLKIYPGETIGIVGESGCGKSTLGKTALRLLEPTSGKVKLDEENLIELDGDLLKKARKKAQYIFQDPYSSLNPRMKVREILSEPFIIHNIYSKKSRELENSIKKILVTVSLPEDALEKYPHEFSGGQRQRIGIARAIALNPELIIADEPVSALDVSVQSQILNLLLQLKQTLGLSVIFITHDLSVVYHVSDRVLVMYLGKVVEESATEDLFTNPKHPYTKALLESVPSLDFSNQKKFKNVLDGDVPSPINLPKGCSFNPRCPLKSERCLLEEPNLEPVEPDKPSHKVACFNV